MGIFDTIQGILSEGSHIIMDREDPISKLQYDNYKIISFDESVPTKAKSRQLCQVEGYGVEVQTMFAEYVALRELDSEAQELELIKLEESVSGVFNQLEAPMSTQIETESKDFIAEHTIASSLYAVLFTYIMYSRWTENAKTPEKAYMARGADKFQAGFNPGFKEKLTKNILDKITADFPKFAQACHSIETK